MPASVKIAPRHDFVKKDGTSALYLTVTIDFVNLLIRFAGFRSGVVVAHGSLYYVCSQWFTVKFSLFQNL